MLRSRDSFFIRYATAIAILTVTLLSGLSVYVFYRQNLQIIAARGWVQHTYEVKGHIQQLESQLRDAAGGERSYLFTGDDAFLNYYNEALRPAPESERGNDALTQHHSINEEIDILRRQTADNPVQQQNIDELQRLTEQTLDYLAACIRERKAGALPLDALVERARQARSQLESIRGLIAMMTAEENHILALRTQADAARIDESSVLIFSSIAVFYVMMVCAIWVYQHSRRAAQAALMGYAAELERNQRELKAGQDKLTASNLEIEASNRELEQQNAQIRQQSDELRASHRMIEEKVREVAQISAYKSEFLANMSHELRTPLNSLLILAKSLAANEQGNLTADQVEEAGIIYNDGLELLTLINDILDLSKVEAGRMEVVCEDVAIDCIAQRLRQQFLPIARDRQVEFPVLVENGVPRDIHTDAHRVEQIMKNLLSNAFKFTETGSVTLRIYRPDPHEAYVAFAVIDTGIGIDPARFEDIFEAFRQAEGSIDRHYGGTGLGLTIARKFAHLLGGRISVESRKGVGSTFTLIVPTQPTQSARAA